MSDPDAASRVEALADGLLLVDKPRGSSSHDVVRWVRKVARRREVGHAGTLDPMATGLLVVAVGEGLKLLRWLGQDDKRYLATLTLGSETDSHDADGRVVKTAPVPEGLSRAQVEEAVRRFVGRTRQRVPVVSAVKRDGEPLYARFRRGEAVEPPERDVTVHALELVAVDAGDGRIDFDVTCEKGFYVRALGRDLAQALGTVGHLTALRRVRSGAFDVARAVDGDALRAAAAGDPIARARVRAALVAIEEALDARLRLTLDAAGCADAAHGRPVARASVVGGAWPAPGTEPLLLCDAGGRGIALARAEDDVLRVVRGLRVRASPG